MIYLSYPEAVTRGLFVGCTGTHAHGHQVTSLFSQNDVITIVICWHFEIYDQDKVHAHLS